MKALRRSLVGASVAALVMSTGAVMAPAPSATEGRIWVSILPNGSVVLQADSSIAPFGAAEELIITAQGRVVRIDMRDDESPSGAGRALLALGSTPSGGWCSSGNASGSTSVTCDFGGPLGLGFPQVRANFGALTGSTTVVMAEGSTVPLAFNGGAGPDYVQGGAGDDWIRGNGGDDFLFGGPGDDYLDGGAGDDYVEGEEGRDDMRGGSGSNWIDAADNTADIGVDCGGLPKFLDFDKDLDEPTNCGANPTPIPPAPIEPVDPPAPGQGDGSVDGAPVNVVVEAEREDTRRCSYNYCTAVRVDKNNILTGLPFVERPIFPTSRPTFSMSTSNLSRNSVLDASIWPWPTERGVRNSSLSATRATPRSQPISTTAIRVNSQGVAEGDVPVPAGQQPGNFTLQVNAVLASGAAVTVNIGVALTQATPDPDPGPTQTIAIAKATRGKGKKAATITVTGTTTGLAGTSVTPRYRVQGAKKWTLGTPVAVTESGSFTWRLSTPKKVRIMMVSGAVKSNGVVVAAVKK